MVGARRKREAVGFLKTREVSERRGCALVKVSRSTVRYESREKNDEFWIEKLQAIAAKHPRCGYRMAWAELRRAGERINKKKVRRLWKKAGLSNRVRKNKRRRNQKGVVPLRAEYPNHVWTYDFMQDATENGRKLRILTVIDEFTRECLAIRVDRRLKSKDAQATLRELFTGRGAPRYLRSDNGSEFTANETGRWLKTEKVETWHIEPGKPWQNAFGESFNGTFRDAFLNMEVFRSAQEAQVLAKNWKRYYNHDRPHSSIGYQTPVEFREKWSENRDLGLSLFGMENGPENEQAENNIPESAMRNKNNLLTTKTQGV